MPEGKTLFERTCRGERGLRTPVWIMRQAGRYLPEYRELRATVEFRDAIRTPEIAAQITMQPMRRYELDAAILFSDIMTPFEGMGVDVRFTPGPVIEEPVRTLRDVRSLQDLTEDGVGFVLESIHNVRAELDRDKALIGFAGAPFTLFCYLVEGCGSKDFMYARRFLVEEPAAATELLSLLARSMSTYLVAQARAGADAIMLFDSWIGLLGPAEFRQFSLPILKSLIEDVRSQVDRPIIYYARGAASLMGAVAELSADVVGVDWTVPLSYATMELGSKTVVQGNLDPAYLFAPRRDLELAVDKVLQEGSEAAAHVFNLGHGIHRATDPDSVAVLVDRVRQTSQQLSA